MTGSGTKSALLAVCARAKIRSRSVLRVRIQPLGFEQHADIAGTLESAPEGCFCKCTDALDLEPLSQ